MPQVNCDIENFSRDDADKLPLRLLDLVMQAPQRSSGRLAKVVLYKFKINTCCGESLGLPSLHKETTIVLVHSWLDQNDSG